MSRPAPLVLREPPSERDRAIFQAVVAEGRSAAEVAADYQLGAGQVRRIVRLVERHFALRQWAQEPHAVLVARKLRLEHLWREALAAWQRSQQDEQIQRSGKTTGGENRAEVARRSRYGDVKFLDLARRLTFDLDAANAALFNEETLPTGVARVEDLTVDERAQELHTKFLALVNDFSTPATAGTDSGPNPLAPPA